MHALQTVEEAEKAALASGYFKSPNNIWSLPGTEWYAGCGGLPCIRGVSNQVRIEPVQAAFPGGAEQDSWPVALYVYLYGGGPCRLALRFPSWADYLETCRESGGKSEPGANYGYYD